jgi:hypothetical protein
MNAGVRHLQNVQHKLDLLIWARLIVAQRGFKDYLATIFRQIQLSVKMRGYRLVHSLCEARFRGLLFPHHVFC